VGRINQRLKEQPSRAGHNIARRTKTKDQGTRMSSFDPNYSSLRGLLMRELLP